MQHLLSEVEEHSLHICEFSVKLGFLVHEQFVLQMGDLKAEVVHHGIEAGELCVMLEKLFLNVFHLFLSLELVSHEFIEAVANCVALFFQ